jgi:hypothetical protein
LHHEQQHAAKILENSIPPPPELPKAAPDGEARPALFDSNDDFANASRRLINHKRLNGGAS